MEKLFENKVILVTGGGSGIGRHTALLFAKHGAKIVIAGRNEERGEEAASVIRKDAGEAIYVKTDVSKSSDVVNLIGRTVDEFGRLDCAFNCGGIDGVKKPLIEMEEQEWDEIIDINLKGTFLLLKYEIIQMLSQKNGCSIVNMASVNGMLGRPDRSAYNSSRSGIIGLTKTAAIEYIDKGIRINAVAPAAVNTDLFQKYTKGDPEIQKKYAAGHPIGRISTPDEIAEAVIWLCSAKSSFVVGHVLVLDGGYTII
jgi:NAD(P)-dependent dehydrogenase (short-subunit alcohol dehydrogenase family)